MPKIRCGGPILWEGPSAGQWTVERICIFEVMNNPSFPLVFGLLFSWMAVFQVSAQIEFINPPDTVYVALDTLGTGALEVHWDVVNNGNGPVDLMVTRFLVETVSPFNYPYVEENEGAHERFCWGPTCFQYGTDASPNNPLFFVSLDSAETDTTFRGDYVPDGVAGPTTIRYCFHPPGQISAGVCHQVTYYALETASLEEAVVRPLLGFELWPNPAQDRLQLQWNQPVVGEVEFRNLVGQLMQSERIPAGVRTHEVSLSDLAPGIWLVSFRSAGHVVSTQRLFVD